MLRFTVAHTDMHSRIVNAAMGARFACVLVEINDDETPVEHVLMERDKWRALGAAKQAGIRGKDPIFWAWLREKKQQRQVIDETTAAQAIRDLCDVLTRSDLGKPGFSDQRIRWFGLDTEYQAWRALENA
jgi:hypothetical protein